MVQLGDTKYVTYERFESEINSKSYSLADFNRSANFIMGLVNKQVDLFDNEFITFKAYQLTPKYELKNEIKLRKCEKADLLAFMPEFTTSYYPNSICFDDRSKAVLRSNWFD